uniref:TonB-dependent receptor n=1 Tax=Altererythrobacter segetis TaxID=1104773 RepID=UPI00140BACF0|nr:TonB-dependent receptor [Altererythrobacter segetis]
MDSRLVSVTALGWAIAALAAPAAAQSASDLQAPATEQTGDEQQASADDRNSGLKEIVVTAEKREENLQKVPAAATALTGDDLDKKAVERVADLQYAAPSLSITDQGLTQSVNIRGIGLSSGSPAVSNGVATYYDNIFQPPILTTGLFYDIGTIEVLRGPQGTFVGSNSTGGAIFINTANPSLSGVSGYAKASYGNYDALGGEGAVNVPLSSTLAVRAAGTFQRRDSYFTDIGPYDNHPDRLNEKAGRLSVLFQPAKFRAVAKVEWVDRNTGGFAYRPIEGTTFAYDRQPDIRTLTYNAPTKVHERGFQSSLEMRYEFDGGVVLRSVSGYVNKRMNNLYDMDAAMTQLTPTPQNPAPASATQTQDQFVREREWVQEVNIISPTDGAFNWIVGGYFQKNKIDVAIQQTSSNPIAFNPADPTDIQIGQNKTTTGVFAQAGYKILPELELQVGGRYSHFKADSAGSVVIGNGSPFFPPGGLQVADLGGSHGDGRFTGKVGLNWTPDEDNLVYAFAARGYKPGGSNGATSGFRPETVWDYEAGWKSSFLDNHVRTQVGAFYMQYKDFQIDSIEPSTGQGGVHNVANATIKGLEAQVQAKIGGFGFDGGIAYVDSKLDQFQFVNQRLLPTGLNLGPQCAAGVPSNPPTCFDYGPFTTTAGGGPNLYSPKWSYNFGVQYQADLGSDLTLTPRLNYAYIGARWTNLLFNPVTDYLSGRGLLSALLTLQKGDWTIEGYGTNLTNKKYVSGQFINNEFYGAPREYGVRASVRF